MQAPSIEALLLCLFGGLFLLSILAIHWISEQWYTEKHKFTTQWHQNFSSLYVFLNSRHLFTAHCAFSIVLPCLAYCVFENWFLVAMTVPVTLYLPQFLLALAQKKRRNLLESQLPDGLMQIAGGLKAGSSLLNAVELLANHQKGPFAQEMALFVREYRMGLTTEQALRQLETRIDSMNISLMVTTISIAQETGGNLSESLERLSESIRQKNMIEKKIESLTSQGKLQGIVVGLLPIAIGAILLKIEPEAMGFIFSTWIGYITILIVFILEMLGLHFIKKIITIDV